MSDRLRMWRWGAWLVLLATAGGCGIQAPQYEALKRNLDVDPRDRVRVYDSCRNRSHSPADLDSCMDGEGYRFVSVLADQDYQAGECWDDHYNARFPKAYCYEKKAAATP